MFTMESVNYSCNIIHLTIFIALKITYTKIMIEMLKRYCAAYIFITVVMALSIIILVNLLVRRFSYFILIFENTTNMDNIHFIGIL